MIKVIGITVICALAAILIGITCAHAQDAPGGTIPPFASVSPSQYCDGDVSVFTLCNSGGVQMDKPLPWWLTMYGDVLRSGDYMLGSGACQQWRILSPGNQMVFNWTAPYNGDQFMWQQCGEVPVQSAVDHPVYLPLVGN